MLHRGNLTSQENFFSHIIFHISRTRNVKLPQRFSTKYINVVETNICEPQNRQKNTDTDIKIGKVSYNIIT